MTPDPRSQSGADWLRSRKTVSLGIVPYDGLILPVVSPDAQFIATQIGPTPSWSSVLGEAGATASGSQVSVLRIALEPAAMLYEIHTLPRGVMLGRSVSARGFIVELPEENGAARGVGLADWQMGTIERLTPPDVHCAFGTVGPGGSIAYSRRQAWEKSWSLVFRDADGVEHVGRVDGASVVFPQVIQHGGQTMILALVAEGGADTPLQLAAFSRNSSAEGLKLVSAVPIGRASSLYDAFQSVAAFQAVSSHSGLSESAPPLVFAAEYDAAAVVGFVKDPGREDPRLTVNPLPAGAFSGVSGPAPGGVVACTLADTFYLDGDAVRASGPQTTYRPALVWPRSGLVRRTDAAEWPYCAFFMNLDAREVGFEAVLVGSEAGAESILIGF